MRLESRLSACLNPFCGPASSNTCGCLEILCPLRKTSAFADKNHGKRLKGYGSSTAAPMSQHNAVGDLRHTSLPYSTDTHGYPHPKILEQAPSRKTTASYSFASLHPQMDRGSLSQEPRPGPLLARQRAVEKRPGHRYTLNKTIWKTDGFANIYYMTPPA